MATHVLKMSLTVPLIQQILRFSIKNVEELLSVWRHRPEFRETIDLYVPDIWKRVLTPPMLIRYANEMNLQVIEQMLHLHLVGPDTSFPRAIPELDELLMEYGYPDVFRASSTILYDAAISNNLELFLWVLSKGANTEVENGQHETALMVASYHGHLHAVKLLLSGGAKSDKALNYASIGNQVSIVRFLITMGSDPGHVNSEGDTPLIYASSKGAVDVVKLLIEMDVDLENQDSDGITALMTASAEGRLDVMRLLIKAGAELERATPTGITALIMASMAGQPDVVRVLIDAGANIEAQVQGGLTALMLASFHKHPSVVGLLISAGADLEKTNRAGDTALFTAAYGNHMEVLRLLINAGANVHAQNNRGRDIMDIALVQRNHELMRLLRERNA
jgi:ankyrin repeat protein